MYRVLIFMLVLFTAFLFYVGFSFKSYMEGVMSYGVYQEKEEDYTIVVEPTYCGSVQAEGK